MVCDAFENVAAERAAMIERARVWSTEVHRRVRLRRVGDWHPRRCGQRCVRAKGGHLHVRVHMQLALPCEAEGGHLHVLQHVQAASAGERQHAFGGRRACVQWAAAGVRQQPASARTTFTRAAWPGQAMTATRLHCGSRARRAGGGVRRGRASEAGSDWSLGVPLTRRGRMRAGRPRRTQTAPSGLRGPGPRTRSRATATVDSSVSAGIGRAATAAAAA